MPITAKNPKSTGCGKPWGGSRKIQRALVAGNPGGDLTAKNPKSTGCGKPWRGFDCEKSKEHCLRETLEGEGISRKIQRALVAGNPGGDLIQPPPSSAPREQDTMRTTYNNAIVCVTVRQKTRITSSNVGHRIV